MARTNINPQKYLTKLNRAKENTLIEIADIIAETASSLAPEKTGSLKASIHVEDGEDKNTKIIGSGLPYAFYQEMGTIKIAPTAYLRKALLSEIPNTIDILKVNLK